MTAGPGRYNDLCTHVREQAQARGVILIVLGGNKGEGFECQADLSTMLTLPDLLERVAKQIRADAQEGRA